MPDVLVLASGSEVHLAVEAGRLLATEGVKARIISVPCLERLIALSKTPARGLMPEGIPKVSVEAGRGALWHQILGPADLSISVETFGASAPEQVLAEKFGLTPRQVAARICSFLKTA